jgi:phage terminase large subunit-like protein
MTDVNDAQNEETGFINLKKNDVDFSLTQERNAEYIRCECDIVYFIEKYAKIGSLDRDLVPFEMRDFQKEIVEAFDNGRCVVGMLARQQGKTTTAAAYLLHEAIFKKNIRIAVLANSSNIANGILDLIKSMIEELPQFLKPGVQEWTETSVVLSNGVRIISDVTNSSSIRGKILDIIYIDELTFIQNDLEFFASTYPVIASSETTKVIITSTLNDAAQTYKLCTFEHLPSNVDDIIDACMS